MRLRNNPCQSFANFFTSGASYVYTKCSNLRAAASTFVGSTVKTALGYGIGYGKIGATMTATTYGGMKVMEYAIPCVKPYDFRSIIPVVVFVGANAYIMYKIRVPKIILGITRQNNTLDTKEAKRSEPETASVLKYVTYNGLSFANNALKSIFYFSGTFVGVNSFMSTYNTLVNYLASSATEVLCDPGNPDTTDRTVNVDSSEYGYITLSAFLAFFTFYSFLANNAPRACKNSNQFFLPKLQEEEIAQRESTWAREWEFDFPSLLIGGIYISGRTFFSYYAIGKSAELLRPILTFLTDQQLQSFCTWSVIFDTYTSAFSFIPAVYRWRQGYNKIALLKQGDSFPQRLELKTIYLKKEKDNQDNNKDDDKKVTITLCYLVGDEQHHLRSEKTITLSLVSSQYLYLQKQLQDNRASIHNPGIRAICTRLQSLCSGEDYQKDRQFVKIMVAECFGSPSRAFNVANIINSIGDALPMILGAMSLAGKYNPDLLRAHWLQFLSSTVFLTVVCPISYSFTLQGWHDSADEEQVARISEEQKPLLSPRISDEQKPLLSHSTNRGARNSRCYARLFFCCSSTEDAGDDMNASPQQTATAALGTSASPPTPGGYNTF